MRRHKFDLQGYLKRLYFYNGEEYNGKEITEKR